MRRLNQRSPMGTIRRAEVGIKRIKAAGVVLIAVGMLALGVGRISYSVHKEVVTIGPYQTPVETRRIIPLRPFGALCILGGLILVVGSKRVQVLRRPRRL